MQLLLQVQNKLAGVASEPVVAVSGTANGAVNGTTNGYANGMAA